MAVPSYLWVMFSNQWGLLGKITDDVYLGSKRKGGIIICRKELEENFR